MLPRPIELRVFLASRPCFFCGCWWLAPADARRAKRIFRLVRAIRRNWERGPQEMRS